MPIAQSSASPPQERCLLLKTNKNKGLSGVYAYMVGPIEITHSDACEADLACGKGCKREIELEPICIPFERDEAGVLHAWPATVYFDRTTKRVAAGVPLVDFKLDTPLITYHKGDKAARDSMTATITGRRNTVSIRSEFGKLLLGKPRSTFPQMILAGWRVEKHDAEKAGFTLEELAEAFIRSGPEVVDPDTQRFIEAARLFAS
jgi:hypothetical protein